MFRTLCLLCGIAMLLPCCTVRTNPLTPATASPPGTSPPATISPNTEPLPEGALIRLGSISFRLTGQPRTLVYDPTGKTLYGSSNVALSRARAFDVATGAPQIPFAGKFIPFDTPSLSRDGSRAACIPPQPTANDNIAVFDTATGRKLLTTSIPDRAMVGPFALSPDGKTLAIATSVLARGGLGQLSSYNHSLRLYDVDSAAERLTIHLGGINQQVSSLIFSPDGAFLAAASGDAIRLFHPTSPSPLNTFSPVGSSLAFSHDSRYLAAAGVITSIWDTKTFAAVAADLPLAAPIAFSPTSHLLAGPLHPPALIGPYDTLLLYDLDSARIRRLTTSHTDRIRALAFSPDGRRLSTAGEDSQLLQFDLATDKPIPPPDGHWSPVHALAWSSDGARLASADDKGLICIWNSQTGAALQHLQPAPNIPIWSISFSGDDRTLSVAPAGSWANLSADTLLLFDTTTWKVRTRLPHCAVPYGQSHLSQDGRFIINAQRAALDIWPTSREDLASHMTFGGFYPSPKCDVLAYMKDDHYVAADFATGKVLRDFGRVGAIDKANGFPLPDAVSPDATITAYSRGDRLLVYGPAPSAAPPADIILVDDTFPGELGFPIALSPDATRVAACLKNREIRLYSVTTGKRLATYRAPARALTLAFSPDSSRLATGHEDASVLLWPATPPNK